MSTNHASKTEEPWLPSAAGRWLGFAMAIALAVVALDGLTKWLVVRELGPNGTRTQIELLGNFVELRYALNSGVAFGLFSGSSTLAGVLVGIVIVPLIIVLALLATRGGLWAIASGLVLGGAAGNLIDRIGDESVTDFISIGRWPSFNIADSAITVGALILIGLSLLEHRSASHESTTP